MRTGGLWLIETCSGCCAGVAWRLRASRGASTAARTATAAAARPLRAAQRGEGAGGAAGGGQLLPVAGPCRHRRPGLPDPPGGHADPRAGDRVLVANRLTSPTPLRRVEDWAATWAVPEVFEILPETLNDDRIGRALDAIAPKLDAIVGSVGAQ